MIFSKKFFQYFLIVLSVQSFVKADCATKTCQNTSQNLWMPRPLSSYKTSEILMLQDHKSRENILSFSTEYMQNFGCKTNRLGSLPFWSGSNTMTIGTNDGKSDLDAYQFGLGDVTKEGSITLTPKVQHVGGEMLWRVAHSSDEAGPYFQVKLPLGAMMIESKVSETPATINPAQDPDWSVYPVQGVRFDTITEALVSGFEHREPDLQYGRLCTDRNTAVRCGDIEAVVGYNFYASEKGYVGAGFKVSCPTGNVPQAKFLLEPIFGRAGHWAVGAELAGAYKVHESDAMDIHLSMRGDVLHLTSGRRPHWRSFDLALNGQGSKYMLLQRYTPVISAAGVEGRMASQIVPAINITTVPVLSTISVEGSFALALQVQKECWNASLIGEFWGRSQECLKLDCAQITKHKDENLNDFAVLGRQINEKNIGVAVPNLNFCEPAATINTSENRKITAGTTDKIKDATNSANRIPADHSVALDVAGAQAPRALTGKVTAEIGYTWTESDLAPHFGLFGGVEFADNRSKFENLWSVGVQGSMIF